jgi:hypothetical protein
MKESEEHDENTHIYSTPLTEQITHNNKKNARFFPCIIHITVQSKTHSDIERRRLRQRKQNPCNMSNKTENIL